MFLKYFLPFRRDRVHRHSYTNSEQFLKQNVLPGQGNFPLKIVTESLLPGNSTDARHQLWLQTPLQSGASYHQSLHGSLSPKLASGKLLIFPTEEKQTDLEENTMAECGSFDAFCLLVAYFPSSFVSSVWCSWSGPISKLLVWDFFLSLLSPYFEALLFPLTQLLLCPVECIEFFL